MRYSKILGAGSYLPSLRVANADLPASLGSDDAWVVQRTGIRARRKVSPSEDVNDLAYHAACAALEDAQLAASSIDLILVATSTPVAFYPSAACTLQARLGDLEIPSFDLSAACSGFVYALDCADVYIRSGKAERVLVVGSECHSSVLDDDRRTAVLFGDGAGAMVLGASSTPGLLRSECHAQGGLGQVLSLPVAHPTKPRGVIQMDGPVLYQWALRVVVPFFQDFLNRAGVPMEAIDLLIPHQANARMLHAMAHRWGLGASRLMITVEEHANTSSASIPLAFCEARAQGRVREGNSIAFLGFGGGLTYGATLLRML